MPDLKILNIGAPGAIDATTGAPTEDNHEDTIKGMYIHGPVEVHSLETSSGVSLEDINKRLAAIEAFVDTFGDIKIGKENETDSKGNQTQIFNISIKDLIEEVEELKNRIYHPERLPGETEEEYLIRDTSLEADIEKINNKTSELEGHDADHDNRLYLLESKVGDLNLEDYSRYLHIENKDEENEFLRIQKDNDGDMIVVNSSQISLGNGGEEFVLIDDASFSQNATIKDSGVLVMGNYAFSINNDGSVNFNKFEGSVLNE